MIALGTKYGEASKLRTLKSGHEYDHLFEKAPGKVYTVKRNAGLADTVAFISKVVRQTYHQTLKLAQQKCKGTSVYDTCKKTWQFVYEHIQYRKDKQGYEQIRSPRRTWHDRAQGVDCDCYSVFISSILTNLGIPHILRITKYNQDHFQHIYPVVPFNGRYIIIDCVTDQFDYEVPYSEKKDYPMDLQFLDGIPDYDVDGFGELGKLFKKKKKQGNSPAPNAAAPSGSASPSPAAKKKKSLFQKLKPKNFSPPPNPGNGTPAPKKKKKGLFKKIGGALKKIELRKVANVVNKVNPAAVALRNGLLLAMNRNVRNISARLYPSYLSPQEAAAQYKMTDSEHQALIGVRKKLEKIFETAGGKVKNLEKAIRKGWEHSVKKKAKKLNKQAKKLNKRTGKKQGVNGLDILPTFEDYEVIPIHASLEQLIGHDIYYSENLEGLNGADAMDGLGELGEPASAIIGAAAAALGIIAGMIDKIFKGKQPPEEFTEEANQEADVDAEIPVPPSVPSSATNPLIPMQAQLPSADVETAVTSYSDLSPESNEMERATDQSEAEEIVEQEEIDAAEGQNNLPAKTNNKVANITPDDKTSFWDKNKTWIKPVAVIGGSLALIAICASALNNDRTKNKSSPQTLSGFPRKKKHHRKGKYKHSKKVAIELL